RSRRRSIPRSSEILQFPPGFCEKPHGISLEPLESHPATLLISHPRERRQRRIFRLTRGKWVINASSAAVVLPSYRLGLIGLRVAKIARLGVAFCSLALLYVYAAPFIMAARLAPPARVHSLHSLSVVPLRFPVLRV